MSTYGTWECHSVTLAEAVDIWGVGRSWHRDNGLSVIMGPLLKPVD